MYLFCTRNVAGTLGILQPGSRLKPHCLWSRACEQLLSLMEELVMTSGLHRSVGSESMGIASTALGGNVLVMAVKV